MAEDLRGCSSAGRAPGLQPGGHRFDPGQLHQLAVSDSRDGGADGCDLSLKSVSIQCWTSIRLKNGTGLMPNIGLEEPQNGA